jgi:hypothetical protein
VVQLARCGFVLGSEGARLGRSSRAGAKGWRLDSARINSWAGLGHGATIFGLLVWALSALLSGPAMASTNMAPPDRHGPPPRQTVSTRAERIDLAQAEQATRKVADHVLASADAAGLPFAVVDKRQAVLSIYRADGRLAGSTPVLLGRTPGDAATTGVGDRAQQARLRPSDLTTPAGRFAAEPGHNRSGEAIIWLDYANALAIHRLRPAPPAERRPERLASPWTSDHLITSGCVVVPPAFYDSVVQVVLGRGRSVVYVLAQDGSSTVPLQTRRQARAESQTATPPGP